MSDVGNICEEAIGTAASSHAAGVGFIEACRHYVAQRGLPENHLSAFYCRLSEALMHRGRSEDAVACARLAFASSPEKEEIANTCAWVFSNCGQHADAAATYESLLKIRPRWVEGHRHASGSFAAAGQIERAILHAKAASDGDPNSFEFTFHAGCLLESTTQYDDALVYFGRALAIDPGNAAVLRRMSGIKFALEQCDDAVNLALRALSLTPDDPLNAQHAGELLLRVGRFDEAACIMLAAVDAHPNDSVGLRLLSAAQMLCGRTEDALMQSIALLPSRLSMQNTICIGRTCCIA